MTAPATPPPASMPFTETEGAIVQALTDAGEPMERWRLTNAVCASLRWLPNTEAEHRDVASKIRKGLSALSLRGTVVCADRMWSLSDPVESPATPPPGGTEYRDFVEVSTETIRAHEVHKGWWLVADPREDSRTPPVFRRLWIDTEGQVECAPFDIIGHRRIRPCSPPPLCEPVPWPGAAPAAQQAPALGAERKWRCDRCGRFVVECGLFYLDDGKTNVCEECAKAAAEPAKNASERCRRVDRVTVALCGVAQALNEEDDRDALDEHVAECAPAAPPEPPAAPPAPAPLPDPLREAAQRVAESFGWHAGAVVQERGKDGVGAIRALHAALAAEPADSQAWVRLDKDGDRWSLDRDAVGAVTVHRGGKKFNARLALPVHERQVATLRAEIDRLNEITRRQGRELLDLRQVREQAVTLHYERDLARSELADMAKERDRLSALTAPSAPPEGAAGRYLAIGTMYTGGHIPTPHHDGVWPMTVERADEDGAAPPEGHSGGADDNNR